MVKKTASGSGVASGADPAADGHGDKGRGCGGPADPGSFDDAELEAILRKFVEVHIDLLEPLYAEVVWRSEIIDQPPSKIAREMNLSERMLAKRLRAGRRALLLLVTLTLQSPIEG